VDLPQQPTASTGRPRRGSQSFGESFDKAYMADMLQDHKKDVADFRKESTSAKTRCEGLRLKTLPTLEDHLKQAQTISAGKSQSSALQKPRRTALIWRRSRQAPRLMEPGAAFFILSTIRVRDH